MNLSPETVQDVIDEYKRTRTPFKVAKRLGLDVRDVWAVIDRAENSHLLMTGPTRYDGYGRPELLRFLVARKRSSEIWDNTLPEIAKCRADYEAGTHEMSTGRDGPWNLLYSTPRRYRKPQTGYFILGE